MTRSSVSHAAREVLVSGEPEAKCAAAKAAATAWRAGELGPPTALAATDVPDQPARPERPVLTRPGDVPRRRLNSSAGRIALMHAVAHIEFNAIDLAFDLIARFGADPSLPENRRADFISDWIAVGEDEARHFEMITARLDELGATYGDLPAHDGLWRAARETADDLAARLAIAPLVLEARGLDVTPGMIERLIEAGDSDSADVLKVIYDEEIAHVAAGVVWFQTVAAVRNKDAEALFHSLVRERFTAGLKPPFNVLARAKAGFSIKMYAPLSPVETEQTGL